MIDFTGLGTTLVGLAAVVTAVAQLRLRSTVVDVKKTAEDTHSTVSTMAKKVDTNTEITEAIHDEVHSANGITGVQLQEREEGRRIQKIPKGKRTEGEQGYVDRLVEGGRDK